MNDLFVRLTADINPVGWKSPTAFVVRRGGRLRAAMAPAMEVATYQQALATALYEQYRALDLAPITIPCRVDLYFSRQLVSYESASGRRVTKHRQDLTNLRKSTEDALQPWLIHNDALVTCGWTEILAQSKTASPSVIVEVYLPSPEHK